MRKLFWILIIIVIILTIVMVVVGFISRVKSPPISSTSPTANIPSNSTTETAPAPVVIQNFAFNPALVRIAQNGTVLWTNHDSTAHSVIFDNGQKIDLLQPGQSAGLKFETAGIFDYHCSIHPWMKGQVVVGQ